MSEHFTLTFKYRPSKPKVNCSMNIPVPVILAARTVKKNCPLCYNLWFQVWELDLGSGSRFVQDYLWIPGSGSVRYIPKPFCSEQYLGQYVLHFYCKQHHEQRFLRFYSKQYHEQHLLPFYWKQYHERRLLRRRQQHYGWPASVTLLWW